MKRLMQFMMAICMAALATACANKNVGAPFSPTDLNSKVTSGEYVQKVDNFIVLLDDSSSMYADNKWQSKIEKAKLVATNMNDTIPASLKLQSGLRAFGPRQYSLADGSALQYGMTSYNQSGLGKAIKEFHCTGGLTPMSPAIDLSKADLSKTQGDIAVILISDGLENVDGPSTAAVKELKAKYQDRVCVYPILIGDDPTGRANMEAIAKSSGCGFATDEQKVGSASGMADFVEKVFLKKAPAVAKPAPAPAPMAVEPKCFTVDLKVEFDFDKANIKSQYYPELLKFGEFVRKHPHHTINLEGHTDGIGSEKYNLKLGQRRADAVRAFLLKHFSDIDSSRLTAISYGKTKPVASNKTKEGRQENRRVFATFTYQE